VCPRGRAENSDVLQYVLEFEPAVAHVENVWSIVDQVGKSMSGVAQNMNAGKVDDATSVLDTGQDQYASIRQSFDSLAGLQPSANFQRFYKLAGEYQRDEPVDATDRKGGASNGLTRQISHAAWASGSESRTQSIIPCGGAASSSAY